MTDDNGNNGSEELNTAESDSEVSENSAGMPQSRRRFTRNAAGGSAVLLTLTNRSAWGSWSSGKHSGIKNKKCISEHLLMSYRQGNPSYTNSKHEKEIKAFEGKWATGDYVRVDSPYQNQMCIGQEWTKKTTKTKWW